MSAVRYRTETFWLDAWLSWTVRTAFTRYGLWSGSSTDTLMSSNPTVGRLWPWALLPGVVSRASIISIAMAMMAAVVRVKIWFLMCPPFVLFSWRWQPGNVAGCRCPASAPRGSSFPDVKRRGPALRWASPGRSPCMSRSQPATVIKFHRRPFRVASDLLGCLSYLLCRDPAPGYPPVHLCPRDAGCGPRHQTCPEAAVAVAAGRAPVALPP